MLADQTAREFRIGFGVGLRIDDHRLDRTA
jgi:hypothetical protein